MNYDVDYFIKKFESIPEEEIGTTSLDNKCALHHCGVENYNLTDEALKLAELFSVYYYYEDPDPIPQVYSINDNCRHLLNAKGLSVVKGKTAKQRILNALYSLK